MTKRQKQRLYKNILALIKKAECLYITFTFSDETIIKTTKENRLRTIKRFLLEQTCKYILNIDYGKKNGREHYHAIAWPKDKGMIYYKAYKLGNITAERIRLYDRFTKQKWTYEKVAEDLTEHATKETTQESKIIYSRRRQQLKPNKYKSKIEKIRLQALKDKQQIITDYYNRLLR